MIPLTPPIMLGLRPGREAQPTHRRNPAGVQGLVFSPAAAADMWAAYGSPPLNPFQPIHSRPAPTATIARLFGASTSRSRWSRGPMTHAATNPETPADRWIT